jgi:hypothetical protein
MCEFYQVCESTGRKERSRITGENAIEIQEDADRGAELDTHLLQSTSRHDRHEMLVHSAVIENKFELGNATMSQPQSNHITSHTYHITHISCHITSHILTISSHTEYESFVP